MRGPGWKGCPVSDARIRNVIAAAVTVSALAILALIWLIYFHKTAADRHALSFLPALDATFNSLSAAALVLGFALIKAKKPQQHKWAMLSAFVFSTLFLIGYVVYHAVHGDILFLGQGPVRPIYFSILISHIVLSGLTLPFILLTFFFSLTGRFTRHRGIARYTLPMWLYVSVTGVIVFLMLRIYG